MKTLVNQIEYPGKKTVQWNGRDSYGRTVGTGIYFYTIKAGDQKETKKMIFLK